MTNQTEPPIHSTLTARIRAEIKPGVLYPQGYSNGLDKALAITHQEVEALVREMNELVPYNSIGDMTDDVEEGFENGIQAAIALIKKRLGGEA